MTVGPDKQCSNGCGTLIYWSDENEYNKNLPYDAKNRQQRHKCPNYKKSQKDFANKANQTVGSALTDKPALERIESKLNKAIELFEAILINQGLYKPASDLE